MISALAGSNLAVTGSRSASVSAGPMPGSTPTAVPSITPMKANIKFAGWIATVRPWAREASASMRGGLSQQRVEHSLERPGRQRKRKQLREDEIDHAGECEADQQVDVKGLAAKRCRGHGKEERGGDDKT